MGVLRQMSASMNAMLQKLSSMAKSVDFFEELVKNYTTRFEKQGYIEFDIVVGKELDLETLPKLEEILGEKLTSIVNHKIAQIPINIKMNLPPKDVKK